MAGLDFGATARGRRRTLDSDINMIPMVDLMMVTISFLLITAVWSHMARLEADARIPGPGSETPGAAEKQLHVEMRAPDKFVLLWKQGTTTIESIDVPRENVVARGPTGEVVSFPALATRIESEWKAKGSHVAPTDSRFDEAVLHTDNASEFKYIVGVMDAVSRPKRTVRAGAAMVSVPALRISFAVGN
jgi:biopolymer transport protein ExbD